MEGMENQGDPDEMRIVIEALFDTFRKYLQPDIIIQNSNLQGGVNIASQSTREDMVQNLLDDVLDGESTIVEFTETLKKLTHEHDPASSVHPAIGGGTEDEKMCMSHSFRHIIQIIDGSLTRKLLQEDMTFILKSLLDGKLITQRDYKQVQTIQNPHECCLEMMKSLKRGKPDWPLQFLNLVKQSRPDLLNHCKDNTEYKDNGNQDLPAQSAEQSLRLESGETGIKELSLEADNYMEDYSTFSRSEIQFHLSEAEKNSLAWQMMVETGNVDAKRITTNPQENRPDKYSSHTSQATFSDEDDSSDEQNENSEDQKETPSLSLRQYQEELAENAVKGRNTIICAPTGSGKTRVAIHIILHHLQQSTGEAKRKVAFLARTVPLVMQQCASLKTYLLPRKFEITYLTGDSEDSMHLHMIKNDNDVIVMTPRILENHLKRNCLPHLGVFSMLVFDECHHTRKGEPYNTLMYSYLKTKKNNPDVPLPQIVGLTASIGIEKAVQDEEAVKCILRVCGNLDADSISTVERHEEELRAKVPVPQEEMVKLRERENDEAVEKIIRIMAKLQESAIHHGKELNHDELSVYLKKIPSDKKSQQFGQWAVKVQNVAKSIPRLEHRETNNSVRSLIIITDYLSAYNVALELYDLVLLKDVMSFLEKSFSEYHGNGRRTTNEDTLFNQFAGLKELVKGRLEEENPNLTTLKNTIVKYLIEKGEKSCGIIFVKTRALTDAITSWLDRCGEKRLQDLKATVFTGTAATVEQGGMTTAEQDEVIRRFRSGEIRLLVATSVGEEGLDIPDCNLVIKYNHVGNEVTTVQTRGRSRRAGGISVLLAMDKTIRKERINQEKAKMMNRAIKKIRQMKRSKIRKLNLEHQEQIMKEEEIHEIVKQQEESRLKKIPFKMVCVWCRKVVIDSKDIKTIFGTHRVVVNREILSQTKTYPLKDVKIMDELKMIGSVRCKGEPEPGKQCHNKLGSMLIYSKVPFFVLGIKYFGFDTGNNLGLEYYPQWKKVPYVIDEIAPSDFQRYLPEKAYNAAADDSDDEAIDSDDNSGDDDDRGNKPQPPGRKEEQDGASPSETEAVGRAQGGESDSLTLPKNVQGAGKDMHQERTDSGVYSEPADSEGSSSQFSSMPEHHSTEVKGTVDNVRHERVITNQEDSSRARGEQPTLSVYNSRDSYHNTPLLSEGKFARGFEGLKNYKDLNEAERVLEGAPSLSAISDNTNLRLESASTIGSAKMSVASQFSDSSKASSSMGRSRRDKISFEPSMDPIVSQSSDEMSASNDHSGKAEQHNENNGSSQSDQQIQQSNSADGEENHTSPSRAAGQIQDNNPNPQSGTRHPAGNGASVSENETVPKEVAAQLHENEQRSPRLQPDNDQAGVSQNDSGENVPASGQFRSGLDLL